MNPIGHPSTTEPPMHFFFFFFFLSTPPQSNPSNGPSRISCPHSRNGEASEMIPYRITHPLSCRGLRVWEGENAAQPLVLLPKVKRQTAGYLGPGHHHHRHHHVCAP
ncbi:hypothetical protein MAPG_03922 [Magnaporthiopsis poae ATCC 64411]|uniref:Uncharacterized protein n=1 Tax=Magnaporthiopsis poae (strain ATCC 64411 / 73-15) TaxID=644358 RepID=A0A0C4DVC0_MAGP6|nr:hypothetical protein MAPG_03922 [Magnaporthiopsis poae ATCC 64411]